MERFNNHIIKNRLQSSWKRDAYREVHYSGRHNNRILILLGSVDRS